MSITFDILFNQSGWTLEPKNTDNAVQQSSKRAFNKIKFLDGVLPFRPIKTIKAS